MDKRRLQLDNKKLLGFRLLEHGEINDGTRLGGKIGDKRGIKNSNLQAKLGAKVGGKVGRKA